MCELTTRAIKAGEELFMSYGDDYWKDREVVGVARLSRRVRG